MTIDEKKSVAIKAIEALDRLYPEAECSLEYDRKKPYQLLLAVRLSAQCTDARVNIVCRDLFSKYKTLESLAEAEAEEIEKIIRPCGLGKTKSISVKGIAEALVAKGGVIPDTMEQLLELPGVGRKTANLILGDIYGIPGVVTDTHCIRISGRLGLVESQTPVKVEKELLAILPPEKTGRFCHQIVLFGREFCTARSPKCAYGCPMESFCLEREGNL